MRSRSRDSPAEHNPTCIKDAYNCTIFEYHRAMWVMLNYISCHRSNLHKLNTRVLIPNCSHKYYCLLMLRHTQCIVHFCRTSLVGRNPSESPASTRTQWCGVGTDTTLVFSQISYLEHGVRGVEEFHLSFNFGLLHKLCVLASQCFVRSASHVEL